MSQQQNGGNKISLNLEELNKPKNEVNLFNYRVDTNKFKTKKAQDVERGRFLRTNCLSMLKALGYDETNENGLSYYDRLVKRMEFINDQVVTKNLIGDPINNKHIIDKFHKAYTAVIASAGKKKKDLKDEFQSLGCIKNKYERHTNKFIIKHYSKKDKTKEIRNDKTDNFIGKKQKFVDKSTQIDRNYDSDSDKDDDSYKALFDKYKKQNHKDDDHGPDKGGSQKQSSVNLNNNNTLIKPILID